METMTVEFTANGIKFDVEREGFCPFAIVWQTEAGTFTINASAGNGGSISPTGSVPVEEGGDQAFIITPDSGYEIADVLVDGESVSAVGTYTFENAQSHHTINATFRSTGSSDSDRQPDLLPGRQRRQ